TVAQSFFWAPLVLYAEVRTLREPQKLHLALTGAIAFAALAWADAERTLTLAPLLVGVACTELVRARLRAQVRAVAVGTGTALALIAGVVVPFALERRHLLLHSEVAGASFHIWGSDSWTLGHPVELLFRLGPVLAPQYVGAPLVVLALAAPLLNRAARPRAWALAALGGGIVLFAMGPHALAEPIVALALGAAGALVLLLLRRGPRVAIGVGLMVAILTAVPPLALARHLPGFQDVRNT